MFDWTKLEKNHKNLIKKAASSGIKKLYVFIYPKRSKENDSFILENDVFQIHVNSRILKVKTIVSHYESISEAVVQRRL